MIANHTTAHEAPTCFTRHELGLGDLGRHPGGAARCGAVATRQALNPIRLPFPELLHVVVFVFLQEVNGRTRVIQHVKGRDVVVITFEESAMVTAMTAQARSQGQFRAANVDLRTIWRGDAVNAPKEGLVGGRVIEIHLSGHCERVDRVRSFTRHRSDI